MAERVTEIYSLLVPLVDGRLIIPRACVAEVVGFIIRTCGAPNDVRDVGQRNKIVDLRYSPLGSFT